jgi:hypothetical protein
VDSVESRSRWKGWDVFRTYKRQKDEGLDDQTISRFRKITKVQYIFNLLYKSVF